MNLNGFIETLLLAFTALIFWKTQLINAMPLRNSNPEPVANTSAVREARQAKVEPDGFNPNIGGGFRVFPKKDRIDLHPIGPVITRGPLLSPKSSPKYALKGRLPGFSRRRPTGSPRSNPVGSPRKRPTAGRRLYFKQDEKEGGAAEGGVEVGKTEGGVEVGGSVGGVEVGGKVEGGVEGGGKIEGGVEGGGKIEGGVEGGGAAGGGEGGGSAGGGEGAGSAGGGEGGGGEGGGGSGGGGEGGGGSGGGGSGGGGSGGGGSGGGGEGGGGSGGGSGGSGGAGGSGGFGRPNTEKTVSYSGFGMKNTFGNNFPRGETIDPNPVKKYFPSMTNLTKVCAGRTTIYNEFKIDKWLMRGLSSRKLANRAILMDLRKELFDKGMSESCHNLTFTDWQKYQECALRRNQRMEYFIPKYPRQQIVSN